MLTLSDLQSEVRHALGGGEPSSERTSTQIVNEAGNYLFTMHQWNFRNRPQLTITIPADQDYVELPHDFGTCVTTPRIDGLTTDFAFTSHSYLMLLRDQSLLPEGFDVFGAIVYPASPAPGVAMPRPRIELHPTSSSDGTLRISYRARWIPLTQDNDVANVPEYAEGVLRECVRAVAQGYEDDDIATKDQRLAMVAAGPCFMAARSEDAHAQSDVGVVRNGQAQRLMSAMNAGAIDYMDSRPISDPA